MLGPCGHNWSLTGPCPVCALQLGPPSGVITGASLAAPSGRCCDHCYCTDQPHGGFYRTGQGPPHQVCCMCGNLRVALEEPSRA